MAVFVSHSEEETLAFAKRYSESLSAGDVVLLEGGLGAGKTVFAKGVAGGLGISDEVTSPTYAYVNVYGNLCHFDCYRIPDEAYAEMLGFSDYFNAENICLVEWSERIKGLLPDHCKRVKISGCGSVREIEY